MTTVERVDEYGEAIPSTEPATCGECGRDGWCGDWPGQGGIVHEADGVLRCDDCADDTEPTTPQPTPAETPVIAKLADAEAIEDLTETMLSDIRSPGYEVIDSAKALLAKLPAAIAWWESELRREDS